MDTTLPSDGTDRIEFQPQRLLGSLIQDRDTPAALPGSACFVASMPGDGLEYRFQPGALAGLKYLTCELLLDGDELAVFSLTLREGESGPAFILNSGLLNHVSARFRMPMEAVNQSRWSYNREGAWLKVLCGGDRVDLKRVDRMSFTLLRMGDKPVRWCMTPFIATTQDVEPLAEPVLPRGELLDELGQSTTRQWPGKTRNERELIDRLRAQLVAAPSHRWPDGFSRWGGWAARRVAEPSGFFRTHHDGRRWWLVDPDGCVFWSSGMDCVAVNIDTAYEGLQNALKWLPPVEGDFASAHSQRRWGRSIDYLAANLIRAFGAKDWHERWSRLALGQMKRIGFNTVANWSDWKIAQAAGFPYVRPLNLSVKHTSYVYRDFPDVFDPAFQQDADEFARQLEPTLSDPAMIGYFLMNEPTWGFASETPAAGMLYTTPKAATRTALAQWLRQKYASEEAMSRAWGMQATFAAVESGIWTVPLTDPARQDLAAFSSVMADKLFSTLSGACKRYDPHHLNLGARYYTVPPQWALTAMQSFDVFSMNCYQDHVSPQRVEAIHQAIGRPLMVGEWHFGALDVGLPASGIGRVANQTERGRAFRLYCEQAATLPACVGVHYFTLYDQSALGRFDGENYNIGFLDVCHRPYEPLCAAARLTHDQLYRVALGEIQPYDDAPTYLPKLFS